MSTHLKDTQDCLRIQDVSLRASFVNLNEEYEAFNLQDTASKLQIYRQVANVYTLSSNELEHSQDSDTSNVSGDILKSNSDNLIYVFRYSVGTRLVEVTSEESSDEPPVILEITAEFDARYKSKRLLNDDEIHAFSKDNVGVNVWPYWREFVHSSCCRVGLKETIHMPFYRMTPKAQTSEK